MKGTAKGRRTRKLLKKGEHVLCFHGPLIYAAKVVDVRKGDDLKYLIHYRGWKRKWDEWVPADRILPVNERNLKVQADNNAAHTVEVSRSTSFDDDGRDQHTQLELTLSDVLQGHLVDDWENVTKDRRIVALPKEDEALTVRGIVKAYRDDRLASLSVNFPRIEGDAAEYEGILNDTLSGLLLTFNESLACLLLYRFEKRQYLDLRKAFPQMDLCDLYGVEHLLRLIVRIPEMFSAMQIDPSASRDSAVIIKALEDISGFLHLKHGEYFSRDSNYDYAPSHYMAHSQY